MKNLHPVMKKVALFREVEEEQLKLLLGCLDARTASYRKNQSIYQEDDRITTVGIILSGKVQIVKDDIWGNRTILNVLEAGDMFGEAFSCAGEEHIPASVWAAENTEVLVIDYKRIITTCSSACAFHSQLIKNMLYILGKKNLQLTQKVEHITQRTTKEKVLSYLSAEAKKQGNDTFDIPLNRQELADYLAVDRSALSNELSKMQEEGILTYQRNHFVLNKIS